MTTQTTQKSLEDQLEALIDSHSLSNILDVLSQVCLGKASHLEENWQDHVASRDWEIAAQKLDHLAWKHSATTNL